MDSSSLIYSNTKVNIKHFLLDPLSVIIKLAIIGNKPLGTKLLIQNNIIYFQEPGMFQPLSHIFYNTKKTDLQYIYNPIQIACTMFLSKENIQKIPRIKNLFICAQNGLKKLMEMYKSSSIIIRLNYHYAIITNYVEEKYTDSIFYKDTLTSLYTKDLIQSLNEQWTTERIKVILDSIMFLTNDTIASNNVKILETIMENTDSNSQKIISNF